MAAEKRGQSPDKVDMANMKAFLIQDGGYIDTCDDEISKAFGLIDGYLNKGLGLKKQEQERLQETMVD